MAPKPDLPADSSPHPSPSASPPPPPKLDRAAINNRIDTLGMRPAADALRQEIRLRHQAAGQTKAEANNLAWAGMWEHYQPVVEKLEARAKQLAAEQLATASTLGTTVKPEPLAPQLTGLSPDTNSLLDPDYTEPDTGKQLRDGYLWAAMQFQLIIRDTDIGPVANLAAASTPPPNPFALLVLSTYALSPIEKRRDLIARALTFATKHHDTTTTPGTLGATSDGAGADGGFLDGV